MNEKCRIESTVISDMSGFDNSDAPLDTFNNHKCPGQESNALGLGIGQTMSGILFHILGIT